MRDRLAVARHSAWRQFGRRHSSLFVGLDVARWLAGPVSVLVVLGGAGLGLWWMTQHLSPGRLALWSGLAAVALAVGWLVVQLATGASVRRRAGGVSRRVLSPNVAVLFAVLLLAGASVSALVR